MRRRVREQDKGGNVGRAANAEGHWKSHMETY